ITGCCLTKLIALRICLKISFQINKVTYFSGKTVIQNLHIANREFSYLCNVETVLEKKDIRAFTPEELKNGLAEMGQPGYRATQVWEWLWKKSASSFDE